MFFIMISNGCQKNFSTSRPLEAKGQTGWQPGEFLRGHLDHPGLIETSGLAHSLRSQNLLWAHNDGGDEPVLYALTGDGAYRGKVRLLDAGNIDWEDMASFKLGPTPYLLVGDVGDNMGVREYCVIYIIEEPVMAEKVLSRPKRVQVAAKISFQYADGPRDCEGVGVDPGSGQILLLTKRTVPPVIYSLPLGPLDAEEMRTARPLVSIKSIPRPTPSDILENPRFGPYRSQPTAMDISQAGDFAMILTYGDAYRFDRGQGRSWSDAFSNPPRHMIIPPMRQAESLCIAPDGESFFITSEQRPAPIYQIETE